MKYKNLIKAMYEPFKKKKAMYEPIKTGWENPFDDVTLGLTALIWVELVSQLGQTEKKGKKIILDYDRLREIAQYLEKYKEEK